MLLNIRYQITEVERVGEYTSQHLQRDAQLRPIRIVREPCGKGAAANRFRYYGIFTAPSDAAHTVDGMMRGHIVREVNPHFKPKALYWDGNTALV